MDLTQQLLFMITGWQTSDEKEGGFNSVSRIVGVQIDLGDLHLGAVTISNVASRVKELTATIDEVLLRGKMSASEMRTLRGRLVFCRGTDLWAFDQRAYETVVKAGEYGR